MYLLSHWLPLVSNYKKIKKQANKQKQQQQQQNMRAMVSNTDVYFAINVGRLYIKVFIFDVKYMNEEMLHFYWIWHNNFGLRNLLPLFGRTFYINLRWGETTCKAEIGLTTID